MDESARKELDFYRRRVDELAGQAVRADSVVSRAKRELKQRRQGFALLTELHQVVTTDMSEEAIFREVVDRLERHLKMDRSIILRREPDSALFRPCYNHGFPAEASERLPAVCLELPEPLAAGEAPLLVTNATALDALTGAMKLGLETPFFVAAPIAAGEQRDHVLLSGRMREAKPFFPPLDEGTSTPCRASQGSWALRCTTPPCSPTPSGWPAPSPGSYPRSSFSSSPGAASSTSSWAIRRSR